MLQRFRALPPSGQDLDPRPRTKNTQKMSTAAASAPNAPRQRSQYSLYDDIRCTGDGEPPQCDLPMEVVCNIFDYANFDVRTSSTVTPSTRRAKNAGARRSSAPGRSKKGGSTRTSAAAPASRRRASSSSVFIKILCI